MSEREKLESCYRMIYQGIVERNTRMLSEILDSAAEIAFISGLRQSKSVFIQSIEDGTLRFDSVDHQRIICEICGKQARILGNSIVHAAVLNGGWFTSQIQIRVKLIQIENAWKIIEIKAN